jgi:hypothetical protein
MKKGTGCIKKGKMPVFGKYVTLVTQTLREYYHVYQWLKTGFGLVIGFINHLQVVTTINNYIIAALHNLQSLHTNLFSLSVLVFTDL